MTIQTVLSSQLEEEGFKCVALRAHKVYQHPDQLNKKLKIYLGKSGAFRIGRTLALSGSYSDVVKDMIAGRKRLICEDGVLRFKLL